jgi:glycosyltransferase involved in cell wall biosynthesis
LKIIHILNHFLPDKVGGTEVYVKELCKGLNTSNYTSEIIVPNFNSTKNAEYIYEGIKVTKYAETSKLTKKFLKLNIRPNGFDEFCNLIDAKKPDIVHIHEFSYGIGISKHHIDFLYHSKVKFVITFHIASYLCRTGTMFQNLNKPCNGIVDTYKCSKCYLYTNHNYYLAKLIVLFSSFFFKYKISTSWLPSRIQTAFNTAYQTNIIHNDFLDYCNNSNAIVVVSKWFKDVLMLNGITSSKIFLNEQTLPYIITPELKKTNRDDKLNIVFVGRVNKQKGIHLLLNAIDRIPESLIALTIYGPFEDIDFYQNCLNQTKNKNNVFWKGSIEHESILKELQFYDLLCLPSTLCEMSSLVIQEAKSIKLPVLASSVPGNNDHITHNHNGFLFDFNSEQDLYTKLYQIVNDRSILQKVINNIEQPDTFTKTIENYKLIYNNL